VKNSFFVVGPSRGQKSVTYFLSIEARLIVPEAGNKKQSLFYRFINRKRLSELGNNRLFLSPVPKIVTRAVNARHNFHRIRQAFVADPCGIFPTTGIRQSGIKRTGTTPFRRNSIFVPYFYFPYIFLGRLQSWPSVRSEERRV